MSSKNARVPHPWLIGRRAAIATKHGKEQQFGPPLQRRFGINVEVADFDTDLLGTFTGTIARTLSSHETARRKAELAVQITGCPIGLGSEGSFGSHPAIPFLPAAVETVVFLDVEHDVEITETLLTTNTNHSNLTVYEPVVPAEFLTRVGFPDHALIITAGDAVQPVATAVQDEVALQSALRRCLEHAPAAVVTADLRAHLNPTRRQSIAELAAQLVERLDRHCPACAAPGWGITAREAGMVCAECDTPTDLIAVDVWTCASARCNHETRQSRPGVAGPESCPFCNP